MHRVGKPGDQEPIEDDRGHTDHTELNNIRHDSGDEPLSLVVTAIFQLERNRRRTLLFEGSLAADPAWDVLLLIYIYQANGTPVSEEIICRETGLPEGTVSRYVSAMRQDGLLKPSTLAFSATGNDKMKVLLSSAGKAVSSPQPE